MITHKTDYLYHVHTDQPKYVDKAVIDLANINFGAIAFTGMSGAMMGPVIAYKMKKHMICVRKQEDNCHSMYQTEGPVDPMDYVIVDDQISSGRTCNRIMNEVRKELGSSHHCVGIYLYNHPYESTFWHEQDNDLVNDEERLVEKVRIIGSKDECIEPGFGYFMPNPVVGTPAAEPAGKTDVFGGYAGTYGLGPPLSDNARITLLSNV